MTARYGLAHCSAESFDLICSFITDYDLSKLYFCGNCLLINLIRSSVSSLSLTLLRSGRNDWPALLSDLPALHSLKIGTEVNNSRLSRPFLPTTNITSLPKTLRALKLQFANAYLSLFPSLVQFNLNSDCNPEPYNLSSIFPNLQVLHVSNPYSAQETRISSSNLFRALGRLSLLELSISPFETSLSDLNHLSRSIERLKITPNAFRACRAGEPLILPSGLILLHLSGLCENVIPILPKNLTSLELEMSNVKVEQQTSVDNFNNLPRDLRRLVLKSRFPFGIEESKALPRHLEYLDLFSASEDALAFAELPRSLTHFSSACDYPITTNLPKVSNLPPNIKKFTTIASWPLDLFSKLPESIEEVNQSYFQLYGGDAIYDCLPNLKTEHIMSPQVVTLTSLLTMRPTLRRLILAIYGPSPAAAHDQAVVSREHFLALNNSAPHLRELVIHCYFWASSLEVLTVPLESIEIANCHDASNLFMDNAPLHNQFISKDKKSLKMEKKALEKEKKLAKKSGVTPASNLWAKNLQKMTLWSNMSLGIRNPVEFIARIPSTLKELRFYHKLDPIGFPFSGVEMLNHGLPPELEVFAALFDKFPTPSMLQKLPSTLRELHLGGRSDSGIRITIEHLKALPHHLRSITIPLMHTLPSMDVLNDWVKDRLELESFTTYSNPNIDPSPPFSFMLTHAPLVSLEAALKGDFKQSNLSGFNEASSSSSVVQSKKTSEKKAKSDSKEKKEKKDKKEKKEKK